MRLKTFFMTHHTGPQNKKLWTNANKEGNTVYLEYVSGWFIFVVHCLQKKKARKNSDMGRAV